MIVVTVDQRGSRRSGDRVPQLLELLGHHPTLRAFQRTAGDEVQAVFDDAAAAVGAALDAAGTGEWNVGLGVGGVNAPLPQETRAGSGPAFEAARDAVERSKRTQARVALSLPGQERQRPAGLPSEDPSARAARLEAELALIALSLRRRSEEQWSACRLRERGWGQARIAAELGVSQQAVSARLNAAWFEECQALTRAVIVALGDIDAAPDEGEARQNTETGVGA
jgi:hypothetical protein